jgi:hypothetical protein
MTLDEIAELLIAEINTRVSASREAMEWLNKNQLRSPSDSLEIRRLSAEIVAIRRALAAVRGETPPA